MELKRDKGEGGIINFVLQRKGGVIRQGGYRDLQ